MNSSPSTTPAKTSRTPILLGVGAIIALGVIGALLWQAFRPAPSSERLGRLEGDMHALLFTNDGRVLYGQHGGIQVSSDGGQTWSAPSGQGDAMALGPAGASTLYLAGHDVFQKSTDGGKTWTNPGFGDLPGTDIHGFAVAPSNGWLYANLAGKGLYRSTDGGRGWQAISPATGGAMAIAAGPGTPPALFAATMGQGLIRSTDGGANWQPTAPVPQAGMSAIFVHPATGNVYSGGQGGVLRSTDGGASWTVLGPGEPIALVATDPKDESRLIAVAQSGQVYRSDDGGRTWKGR